jgi:glutathione S-transferase
LALPPRATGGFDRSRARILFDSRRERYHDWNQGTAGWEDDVLELYHNINSVCAQKVRIALKEKGQEAKEHLLTLRGDQFDPAYLKLNPGGVVPTIVHDGNTVIESSLILYYLDEVFPDPPLMPKAPELRHRVRMYNKLIDEYLHNSCMILTFATAFRPNFIKLPRETWLAEVNKSPLKRRAEYKRSVIEHGLDSEFVTDAVAQHQKLLFWMNQSLQNGQYLVGDSFSNADCAVIPYILRLELLKLRGMWNRYPAIDAWWERMRVRPSVKTTVFDVMTETDWAPFRNLAPDPWPKVETLLKAA